jgi:hypothetical protein
MTLSLPLIPPTLSSYRSWFYQHSTLAYAPVISAKDEVRNWEEKALPLLLVVALIKFYRRQSLDGYLATLFSYLKSCVLALAFFMDVRIFTYYIILYWLHVGKYKNKRYTVREL